MDHTETHLSQFHREFLWELELARKQITELAEYIPEDAYGWRPAPDARSFSAVLVHIAMANLMLLYRADVYTPSVMEVCGGIEGEGLDQWVGTAHKGLQLERTITAKSAVLDLLKRSFDEVRAAFAVIPVEELRRMRDMGTEVSTFRRIYLRILVHGHEHMGQAVAYARTMGYPAPWPDPVQVLERMAAEAATVPHP